MKYSVERREAILRKLLPPNNRPVTEVAQEEGISDATLYNWRNEARKAGQLLPDHGSDPEGWSSRDKFNAVLEAAALNESELGEYCRKRGIYPEQVRRWRQSCETANERDERLEKRSREAVKQEKKRTRQLERELQRKDAALAETAALLTLRKKARAIWGGRGRLTSTLDRQHEVRDLDRDLRLLGLKDYKSAEKLKSLNNLLDF